MTKSQRLKKLVQSAAAPGLALLILLGIAGYAILGPTGLLAWGDYESALKQRNSELQDLQQQRASLRNRVELLDPENVDPDLANELIRKQLNAVHPDDIIVSTPAAAPAETGPTTKK